MQSGPTLTLRPPAPADAAGAVRAGLRPRGHALVLLGARTRRSSSRWPTSTRPPAARERGEQLDLLIVHREHGPVGDHRPRRSSRGATAARWSARGSGARYWGTGANRESKALVAHLGVRGAAGWSASAPTRTPSNVRSHAGAARASASAARACCARWHRHGDRQLDVNVFGMLRDEWAAAALRDGPGRASSGAPPAAFAVTAALSRAASQLKPRTAKHDPERRAHSAITARSPRLSASAVAGDHRAATARR